MKFARLFLLMIVAPAFLSAAQTGDTYEQVIKEKGAPTAKLGAGQTLILNYPDQRIKLKDGIVVEVNSKLPEVTVSAEEPSAPKAPGIALGTWTTNYEAAMAQARKQNAKVFLFFTGSDWCGWCKRLDAEILSTEKFKTYAGKNLILVKLDFPHSIPQTDAVKAQNEALAQKHQVSGFPTVIVLNSSGKTVGSLGYQPGGADPFIEALRRF